MLKAISKAAFRVRSLSSLSVTILHAIELAQTAPSGVVSVEIPKEQDQRSFFLRMYGTLFVLTACAASTCPHRPGVAAFRTLTPGTFTRETRWNVIHV